MFRKYYRPESLAESLGILESYAGRARVIAGGTDLVLQLMQKETVLDAVVDISLVQDLRYIREESDQIKIGAVSTHTDLSTSPLLREKVAFLAEAANSIGSLQIRNVGTVGGNIVSAQPAADTEIPLMALDAVVTVVSARGTRKLPLSAMYHSAGGTVLDFTSEILTEISFFPPGYAGGAGSFGRVAKRKAVSLPVFNTAVIIYPDARKKVLADARIVMGPVALTPFRARKAEQVLRGSFPGEESFCRAAGLAADEARPRDSRFRGSAAYRKELARVMVLRALTIAQSNLDGQGVNR